jgi:hypothetical protein
MKKLTKTLVTPADPGPNSSVIRIRRVTRCIHGPTSQHPRAEKDYGELQIGEPISRLILELNLARVPCMSPLFQRASLTRLSGCGDQHDFRILQSETNSRVLVNLHIHKGSEASVSSYITMNLVSMKETSRRFSPPADPVVLPDLKFKFTHVNGHKVCPFNMSFSVSNSCNNSYCN